MAGMNFSVALRLSDYTFERHTFEHFSIQRLSEQIVCVYIITTTWRAP